MYASSIIRFASAISILALLSTMSTAQNISDAALKRLNPVDFQQWHLPANPPYPADNRPTPERVALGKMLFFDPRISRDGNMSCASCHNPMLGWSDGLATGRGFQGQLLGRASPTVINAAYNTIQMWDGRKKTLEDQAMGPLEAGSEMNTDIERFFAWMNSNQGYKAAIAKAYPGEPMNADTFRKAIASYERTLVSRNSPFDRWVAGEPKAMSKEQLRGMMIFMNPDKGNCAVCHSAPNFTDNGFHNIGLASFAADNPDLGRYAHKPVAINRGAFKTPTLRDVERTAPYFHDGSAKTLLDVVEHYVKGGEVRNNLSKNIKPLNLTQQEKEDLVAYMKALSSPPIKVDFPALPLD
ncbi:cytochrome-c peroxidase [Noviherbaspirillum sp.]|uniref:cytochrome-c peroxidase n=1 Tax=Noviherbaspirillum sp. TaxID=1926288 RepID=UPI002FE1FF4F